MMYSIKSLVDAQYKQKFGFTATKGNIISNIMHFCVYTGLISRENLLGCCHSQRC